MAQVTPPTENTKRELVLHLEELLIRARAGEVQMYVGSAAYLPSTPTGWGEMQVTAFSSFGSLVPRLDEPSLRGVYAKTLEGLTSSATNANDAFGELLKRFDGETP